METTKKCQGCRGIVIEICKIMKALCEMKDAEQLFTKPDNTEARGTWWNEQEVALEEVKEEILYSGGDKQLGRQADPEVEAQKGLDKVLESRSPGR